MRVPDIEELIPPRQKPEPAQPRKPFAARVFKPRVRCREDVRTLPVGPPLIRDDNKAERRDRISDFEHFLRTGRLWRLTSTNAADRRKFKVGSPPDGFLLVRLARFRYEARNYPAVVFQYPCASMPLLNGATDEVLAELWCELIEHGARVIIDPWA